MYEKYNGIVFLFLFGKVIYAQNIVGRWQENTSKVSSGYFGNYQFSDDGTFVYSVNEYFGLGGIRKLNGNYKYDSTKHILSLSVLSVEEVVGGTLERSKEAGEATDSWAIDGGELKKNRLPKPLRVTISVGIGKARGDTQLIILDKRKYYKVE